MCIYLKLCISVKIMTKDLRRDFPEKSRRAKGAQSCTRTLFGVLSRVWQHSWKQSVIWFHWWTPSTPTTILEKWCWSWWESFNRQMRKWKRSSWRWWSNVVQRMVLNLNTSNPMCSLLSSSISGILRWPWTNATIARFLFFRFLFYSGPLLTHVWFPSEHHHWNSCRFDRFTKTLEAVWTAPSWPPQLRFGLETWEFYRFFRSFSIRFENCPTSIVNRRGNVWGVAGLDMANDDASVLLKISEIKQFSPWRTEAYPVELCTFVLGCLAYLRK